VSLTLIFFTFGLAVLSALFIATYGGRSAWVACCSTAMSLATLVGIVFVSSFEDANQVRAELVLLARQLPRVLDQRTLDELISAIDKALAFQTALKNDPRCKVASGAESPTPQGDDQRNDGSSFEAPPARPVAPTTIGLETKEQSATVSRWPITWRPDDSILQVSENPAPGLWIGGINISAEPLRDVQGVLKPDAKEQELKLTVNVQGKQFEDKAVIPAGAGFTLGVENSKIRKQSGGAILTLRYTYAGQQRAEIFYLTEGMIARLASAG
jgi:hypothetical protein